MSGEDGHAVRFRGEEFECSCGISWAGDGWGASIIDHLWRHPARDLPPPNRRNAAYFYDDVSQIGVFIDERWVRPPPVPEQFHDHPHNNTQGEHG